MAMLSQSVPMTSSDAPRGYAGAGAKPGANELEGDRGGIRGRRIHDVLDRDPRRPRRGAEAPRPTPRSGRSGALAALVREQTPREIPREWRYQIKGVKLDGMFRKQR